MASLQDHSTADKQCEALLQMDYWPEELSESQNAHYSKFGREYSEIMAKVQDFIKKGKGEVLEWGSEVMVLQAPAGSPAVPFLSSLVTPVSQATATTSAGCLVSLASQLPAPQPSMPALQPVPSQQLLIQGGPVPSGGRVARANPIQVNSAFQQPAGTFQGPSGTIQFVMDSRLGYLVQTLPTQQSTVGQIIPNPAPAQQIPPPILAPTIAQQSVRQNAPIPARSANKTPVTTSTSLQAKVAPVSSTTSTKTITTTSSTTTTSTVNTHKSKQKSGSAAVSTSSSLPPTTIPVQSVKPTESNSVGGLSAGNTVKRKEQDENKSSATGPDSREVSFNKLSGKTFPSLVVLVRPNIRVKDMAQSKITQDRAALDSKVKCVLMYTATKFTEWLIQQGLVRSEQNCSIHSTSGQSFKLKLGMYSDVTKFPFSGGYVWISDCCPQRFVSVFSGSIFEGAPHTPLMLLKLMYHWCCQTNVQNVVQWVKVDNLYVKNFFTHMRSVCVAAVHEKHEKLGGFQKRVEVGVISLGTTSQDGNMRQVKVEVLGVMDPENKLVRLRAVEPLQDGERNYRRRFVKILEPLEQWVHKDSIILTDFTVDKGTLMSMGFCQVHQSTIPDPPSTASKMSNQNIMEYLRRIVPRMFQNTLSLLSRQIIQQFLDELVWRERWGPVPSQAFDSLVSHLAAQTKIDSGETLIVKLAKIAANPFRNWEYSNWKNNGLISTQPTESQLVPIPTSTLTSSHRSSAGVCEQQNEKNVDAENHQHSIIALARVFENKLDEDTERVLRSALHRIGKGLSLRKAAETFKLPLYLLLDRAKDCLINKGSAVQSVFTEDEEEDIEEHLLTLDKWGYPFGRWDIRLVAKQYLDTCGRTEYRFKDNFPGDLWIEKFLSRHPIVRAKLCRNIPSRGTYIESESVKQYVSNLKSALHNIPPSNILNFIEIGLTGDPLRSMTVELRDLRYPVGKRKVRSCATVMVACTAFGTILPSYIVFEGKSFSTTNEPLPGEYHATKTGWFDENTFQQWLESVLLPWADRLEGEKLVVGDSLAQLFSMKSLALCKDRNITFLCMPCNISGVLSPLDVVLCDKLKTVWRAQTRTWALSNSAKMITHEDFPAHIHKLLSTVISEDLSKQLRTAFNVVGLYPCNPDNAMKALENGGVLLNESEKKQADTSHPNKRKRIYIGIEDTSLQKKPSSGPSKIQEVVLDDKETDNDIVALETALKTSDDLVSVEQFFYGIRKADADSVLNEFKMDNLNAKCPLCHACVDSNLEMMKHLLGHSEKSPNIYELQSIYQCRYCVKNFSNPEEVDLHVNEAHKGLSSQIACLICSVKFESRQSLIVHMHKTHTMLELPYQCSICSFRCSEQFKVVDHFYEVHAGGERLQCPFCLRCVAIGSLGKKIPANTFFFMHHIRKHLAKNSARKCEKCALWFVHKGILKEHQSRDHASYKDDPNVTPYSTECVDSIMMPLPKNFKNVKVIKMDAGNGFICRGLDSLVITGVEPWFSCLECRSNLVEKSHIVGYMSCVHCTFTTCCSIAIKTHLEVFHGKGRPTGFLKPPILLPEDMYCLCGFHTKNGNLLADHLVLCKKNSAYPSAASANASLTVSRQSASFPPLISLDESTGDDPSEQMIKAFSCRKENDDSNNRESTPQIDPPSMLNLLGLVRKNSIEESPDASEVENELNKDRPSSRASSTGSVSRKRKHVADETVPKIDDQADVTRLSEVEVKKVSVTEEEDKQGSHPIAASSQEISNSDSTHQSENNSSTMQV